MSGHTPMVVAAARVLCKRGAEQCNVDEQDSWKVYGDMYLQDAQAALDAAGAPELLAACKVAFDQTCSVGRPKDWEQLRAAISKAQQGGSK